jgi:hypothetical protein
MSRGAPGGEDMRKGSRATGWSGPAMHASAAAAHVCAAQTLTEEMPLGKGLTNSS